ncbi:MAG: hypothetical protein WC723_02865 [Candidatus Omnitrophota bacterium]
MKSRGFKKGQGTLEYAVIVVVVIGALIAMQWYIKGGYQGKLRQASDDMGEQFSPTRTTTNYVTSTSSSTNEQVSGGSLGSNVMPVSSTNFTQTQSRAGSESVESLSTTSDQR